MSRPNHDLHAIDASPMRRSPAGCIETLLRALQRDGSEKAAQPRLRGWGFGLARASTRGAPEDTANAQVAVKRVAKFACEILAPAAAKIVCAGSTDADEALYQTFAGLTDKERFADLDAHVMRAERIEALVDPTARRIACRSQNQALCRLADSVASLLLA